MPTDKSSLQFQGGHGRDEFRRELVADKAIQLLTADIQVSPMVIDGDWGTGKTEFCHKLINKFRSAHADYRVLYIDAFQADHADSPLMTVLSAVMTLLPDEAEKKSFLEKAVPVARFGLTTAGKALVSFTLKQNADNIAAEFEEHLQQAADTAIDASVKALLKDHEKAEENLKALQTTLEKLAQAKPIVIFIDELDRCRPDFVVQMLEVIKHTFDVEGVQFVLVTNRRQLEAAINHRYGHQVDSRRYLDKFLKFSFRLPSVVVGQYRGVDGCLPLVSIDHFKRFMQNSSLLSSADVANPSTGVFGFAKSFIERNDLSLRDVETFVRYLEIYQSLCQGFKPTTIFGYQLLGIFGVYLFCFKPLLAERILGGRTDAVEIAGALGMVELPDCRSDSYRPCHIDVVAVMLAQVSKVNTNAFQIASEQQLFWSERKEAFFRGGWGAPNNLFEPVCNAIRILQLGGE